jgi:hypothetical protein
MGEMSIAPTNSWPRQWMRVSGHHHSPAALYPRGKDPRYPLYWRLGGPQSYSGHTGRGKNPLPLPGIEPRSPCRPVCSQTLYWLSLIKLLNGCIRLKMLSSLFSCCLSYSLVCRFAFLPPISSMASALSFRFIVHMVIVIIECVLQSCVSLHSFLWSIQWRHWYVKDDSHGWYAQPPVTAEIVPLRHWGNMGPEDEWVTSTLCFLLRPAVFCDVRIKWEKKTYIHRPQTFI